MLKRAFVSLSLLFAAANIAVAQEIAEGSEGGQLGLLAIILLFVVTIVLQELILFVLGLNIKKNMKNEIFAEIKDVKSEFKKRFSRAERIQFYCWSAILFMTLLILFAVPLDSLYLTFFCIIIPAEVLQLLAELFSFFDLHKLIAGVSVGSFRSSINNYLNDDSTVGDWSTVGNRS